MSTPGPPDAASHQAARSSDVDVREQQYRSASIPANRSSSTEFQSLLFGGLVPPVDLESRGEPPFFGDLNLDQIVGAAVANRSAYALLPFYFSPLDDLDLIRFRQEIFIDLERDEISAAARWFAKQELAFTHARQLKSLKKDEGGFAHYHYLRSFLNAAVQYCDTIETFTERLDESRPESRGLLALQRYLTDYLSSDAFVLLRDQARSLDSELYDVRFSLQLKGSRITVGPYDEQDDYSAHIAKTFERFTQDPIVEEPDEVRDWDTYAGIGMLRLVSQVYPDLFHSLDAFCRTHLEYLDETIAVCDRQLQFFIGYLDYIRPLEDAGLSFSYPVMASNDKAEQALDTFDLALAAQRISDDASVVCNDITLVGPERTLVITGPNNGGKTTLARTVGQLHYLSRLGCPVQGRDARLFLCDRIFTRFERREDSTALEGKLQDELNRLREVFDEATTSSLFILNEMFSSTTAYDALLLSREVLGRIADLDSLCVCVTFLDELASLNAKTVSMVSGVDPHDPTIRTYRLLRREADGRAYARALAEKYALTYDQLMKRGAR